MHQASKPSAGFGWRPLSKWTFVHQRCESTVCGRFEFEITTIEVLVIFLHSVHYCKCFFIQLLISLFHGGQCSGCKDNRSFFPILASCGKVRPLGHRMKHHMTKYGAISRQNEPVLWITLRAPSLSERCCFGWSSTSIFASFEGEGRAETRQWLSQAKTSYSN